MIVLIHKWYDSIVCLGMHVTCFIPSVHDVEHTVPATGDVCVGYVVCTTTCLCMQAIQCFDCVSGADVCMGHALLIFTRLCMYKLSDETWHLNILHACHAS